MAEPQSTSSSKNIVILGGSYGGVSIAHHLLKHTIPVLPEKETYQVVLVSTSSQAICRPATPRALISDDMFPQDKLFVSIPKQFEHYPKDNFKFIQGTATELDHENRTVTVTRPVGGNEPTEKLSFYALVIATGASTPSPLLSLNGNEQTLREDWNLFRKALPSAKSIVIAGGGPAGIETAGELGEYLNGRAGWFSSKLSNPKVEITVVTSGPQILPLLRPAIAAQAEDFLGKVGVTIIKNTRAESVDPSDSGTSQAQIAAKTTVTLADGKTLDADLYIPAFGMTPNAQFVDKSLLTSDGRVETNTTTLRVDKAGSRIYAVGDVSSYARPAVHLLTEAIPVLGANMKRDLLLAAGKKDGDADVGVEREFKEDKRETHIIPIGKSKGVGAAMGYRLPSFMVWLIKGRDYWLWTTGPLWSGKQWVKAG